MGREYVQQKVTMASLIYALITVASTLSPSIVSSLTSQTQRRPNFVFILADDLDLTLGGASSLPKTSRLIASKGADLTNWFVHTPVCCSSRAEILTGKYLGGREWAASMRLSGAQRILRRCVDVLGGVGTTRL